MKFLLLFFCSLCAIFPSSDAFDTQHISGHKRTYQEESKQNEKLFDELLAQKILATPTFDIGGIRTPLAVYCYSLANVDHLTINCSLESLPDFAYRFGLDFGGFLKDFPNIKDIVTRRTTPLSCLVSHVGNYIFEDSFAKERYISEFLKRASTTFMKKSYPDRFATLFKFIRGLSSYLSLLKGGNFTYKSSKREFEYATRVALNLPEEETHEILCDLMHHTENYNCLVMEDNNIKELAFSQKILRFSRGSDNHITATNVSRHKVYLDKLWPLVGFSHKLFSDILEIEDVQTTLNTIGETGKDAIFHTINFTVPVDYIEPDTDSIAERLTQLFGRYDHSEAQNSPP